MNILKKKYESMKKAIIQFKEDLEFARRTNAALKEYEKGNFKSMEFDEFIKEMKKW